MKIQAIAKFLKQGNAPIQEDHLASNEKRGIFIAADGFGGNQAGQNASQKACESILSFLEKEAGDLEATLPFVLKRYYSLAANVIYNAVVYANQEVQKQNEQKKGFEKGGCSAIAGFMDQDVLALANVGSCTSYLIREGELTELTKPRFYEAFLNPSQKRVHRQRTPLMSLGLYEELEPEILELKIQPGDWLILSTAGLTPQIEEELLGINQNSLNPKQTVQEVKNLMERQDFGSNSSFLFGIF